jgi:hypothetical protein
MKVSPLPCLYIFSLQTQGAIGFELWSMSDGVYFDNIIIAADRKVVEDFARDSFQLKLDVQDAGEVSVAFLKKRFLISLRIQRKCLYLCRPANVLVESHVQD